jgi:hypothetical protein
MVVNVITGFVQTPVHPTIVLGHHLAIGGSDHRAHTHQIRRVLLASLHGGAK